MNNRPHGREKHITGTGKPVQKRGEGLHSGPVGRSDGMPGGFGGSSGGRQGTTRSVTRASGGGGLLKIILALVVLLGGGGAGLSAILGGGSGQQPDQPGFSLSSLFSGGSITNVSSGWTKEANTGRLNTAVDPSARAKRTVINGNNTDTVTIMIYMCGTDLESKNGMASADIREMCAASRNDRVNILLYTGGCSGWKDYGISSKYNQIYKIENGKPSCLVENDGTAAMTKPATLTRFIEYCTEHYPANRNELIFWDHGGGSLSGYGYDEKNQSAGSMTLKGISEALRGANTVFDFIGFDACLMATLENALTVAPYADYLIASEETEPGIGWYYTNWLTALAGNTSMPTVEIGKNIVDDFVNVCARSCSGQKATLSVIDLAELEKTVPDTFRAFAADTAEMIGGDAYKTVSDARSGAREFAASSKIDQVDLVHLAYNMETSEGQALADSILGAVKYNNTSSNMTNAYGLSIYFPYQKTSKVDTAVAAYDAIGIDSEYSKCIKQFAAMETAGQAVSGSSGSPLTSLLGGITSPIGSDSVSGILSGLLSGGSSFLGKSLDAERAAEYVTANRFDASALTWKNVGGTYELILPEDQWKLVKEIELNVFYDDGEGYIDLGCDNVYDFAPDGNLLGEYDGTWLAVNGQPVAYYYIDTVYDGDAYTITGRIPVLLNESRADLIVVFDNANPYGYIAGARADYRDGETETVAKGVTGLTEGDRITFLCDYYSYDGTYRDSYYLGDEWTYTGDVVTISNVYIDEEGTAASALYKLTDIYCQTYWTQRIP